MLREYVLRFIQNIFSLFIFDAPILSNLKMTILSFFFKFGKNTYISYRSLLISPHTRKYAFIEIGNRVGIEHDCEIDYSGGITIEDDVWISEGVFIATHKHIVQHKILKKSQPIEWSPLFIGEDAWIGARSVILSSVNKIGKGAIIGAGTILTRDVEDWAIVVGNPGKVIGFRKD